MSNTLSISMEEERFRARLRRDLAPRSCEQLLALLPYQGKVIHARWSGEALWSPLAAAWPAGAMLAEENPVEQPRPGELLLYAGESSEPELLIPYGASRFACKAGPLKGNPVLTIEDGLDRIAQLAQEVIWNGAMTLRIEVTP